MLRLSLSVRQHGPGMRYEFGCERLFASRLRSTPDSISSCITMSKTKTYHSVPVDSNHLAVATHDPDNELEASPRQNGHSSI